jgi:hypothetical protein
LGALPPSLEKDNEKEIVKWLIKQSNKPITPATIKNVDKVKAFYEKLKVNETKGEDTTKPDTTKK